jgi:hypothetical protein
MNSKIVVCNNCPYAVRFCPQRPHATATTMVAQLAKDDVGDVCRLPVCCQSAPLTCLHDAALDSSASNTSCTPLATVPFRGSTAQCAVASGAHNHSPWSQRRYQRPQVESPCILPRTFFSRQNFSSFVTPKSSCKH